MVLRCETRSYSATGRPIVYRFATKLMWRKIGQLIGTETTGRDTARIFDVLCLCCVCPSTSCLVVASRMFATALSRSQHCSDRQLDTHPPKVGSRTHIVRINMR